jgi:non-ribosomal peptide synthetase component F
MAGSDVPILHEQFASQAACTPTDVALWSNGASITFGALNISANRVASLLRARGIRDGFVGVHAERAIEYVIAVLGILKANCAVVPLPPRYPVSRLRQILDFAQLDAVVDVDASPLDPRLFDRIIHLSESADFPPDAPASARDVADRPAYVLSSSGSTGHPKMIVRSHRSFFHRLRWTWGEHPFDADEVCVQKSHMTTTHAIYELFEPMLRGVPVHIIPDEEVRNLESFWAGLKERNVSRLLIAPSMLQASLDIPSLALPPVKVLVLMGEHVSPTLAARAVDAFPETTSIVSISGSTEASSALSSSMRRSFLSPRGRSACCMSAGRSCFQNTIMILNSRRRFW